MSQAPKTHTRLLTPVKSWKYFTFGLWVSALLLSSQAHPQGSESSQAEKVAEEYMTAFFHGDLQTAASLTHPDTINLFRTSFLKELSTSTSEAGKPVTPADYGLSLSVRELAELDAEALYVVVLEANRNRTTAMSQAMRRTTIEVSGSRETSDATIVVQLRILTPTEIGGTFSQEAGLLLRRSNSTWRVVGNAP